MTVPYTVEVTCHDCGAAFQAPTRGRRFCDGCKAERNRAAAERRRRAYVPTVNTICCENCGTTEQRPWASRWCFACRNLGTTHPRREVAIIVRNRDQLRRVYGLTINQWIALAEAQSWRCALCPTESSVDRPLHVDHCHRTGKVRGLLCKTCNLAIGQLGDTAEALQRVADYLWSSS